MSSWTMPHRVLQIVAFLLVLSAAGSFALGLAGNLQRGGHLPGAQILGAVGGAPTVEAQDAVPLSDERIQGPPPPSPEDKAKAEAKKAAEAARAAEEEAAAAAPAGNAPVQLPLIRPPPPIGNAEAEPPPQEEPPH